MQLGIRHPVVHDVRFPTQGVIDNFGSAQSPLTTASNGDSWSTVTIAGSTNTNLLLGSSSGTVGARSSGACNQYDLTTYGPNCEVSVSVVSGFSGTDSSISLYARLSPVGTASFSGYRLLYTYASVGNGSLALSRIVSAGSTQIGTVTIAGTSTPSFGMRLVGNLIQVYLNASGGGYALQYSAIDQGGGNLVAGKLGLGISSNASGKLDNFRGGTLSNNI